MDLDIQERLNRIAGIWERRMKDAQCTKKANRPAAEAAIFAFYDALGRDKPAITWTSNPATAPGDWVFDAIPLMGTARLVADYAWQRLPDVTKSGMTTRELTQVAARIGYNLHTQQFRMATNWDAIFGRSLRLPGTPRNSRFAWLRMRSNFLAQFDWPALVLWEYCEGQGVTLDPFLGSLVERMLEVLHATFGAIMFLDRCVMIDRPKSISFDAMQLLSSTTDCALEWRDKKKILAVDGVVVSPALAAAVEHVRAMPVVCNSPSTSMCFYYLRNVRAQERMAAIERLGWDRFLALMQCVSPSQAAFLVHSDKYGELWRADCGNQVIMMLKVTNHSPEPDGTYRKHVLPVDPDLRPLPNPRDPQGRMGERQLATALNAVASTFGMTGEQYAAILGKQS